MEELRKEAIEIRDEDIRVCKAIGGKRPQPCETRRRPSDPLQRRAACHSQIWHGHGSMYLGHERGYNFRIYADETRPLLQGARLTSFELSQAGLDVTLICDNMSASVMRKGLVNAVFVGCDRVAANGDTANKIGTSMVALAAKRYNVPFYICAPTSTIDMNTKTGADIKIELRPDHEVTEMWYSRRMAPEGVKVFNPAFDVTDNDLITAIVTEYGIARPPYSESFKKIFELKAASEKKG